MRVPTDIAISIFSLILKDFLLPMAETKQYHSIHGALPPPHEHVWMPVQRGINLKMGGYIRMYNYIHIIYWSILYVCMGVFHMKMLYDPHFSACLYTTYHPWQTGCKVPVHIMLCSQVKCLKTWQLQPCWI